MCSRTGTPAGVLAGWRVLGGLGIQHTLTGSCKTVCLGCYQVSTSHGFVMGRRMVFGEVVSQIGRSFTPLDAEHALLDSVTDPIESHVNGI